MPSEPNKIRYVLGFMFARDGVWLILKKRGPPNVKGHWNGIGGKIHRGEHPRTAMVREAKEESGVDTQPFDWTDLGTMGGPAWECHLFTLDADGWSPRTCEDEEVRWFPLDALPTEVVDNVPALLTVARLNTHDEIVTLRMEYA